MNSYYTLSDEQKRRVLLQAEQMCETMIYGRKLPFAQLLSRIHTLEERFHAMH